MHIKDREILITNTKYKYEIAYKKLSKIRRITQANPIYNFILLYNIEISRVSFRILLHRKNGLAKTLARYRSENNFVLTTEIIILYD